MLFTLKACAIESIGLGNILIIVELALLLWVLASLVDKFDRFFKKFGKEGQAAPEPVSTPAAAPSATATPAPVNQKLVLSGVDEATAAIIMAVVSHQSQIPLENLDFKKIKLIDD